MVTSQPKIMAEVLALMKVNDLNVEYPFNDATATVGQLTNLSSLAAAFPLVTQKLLLFLPFSDLKSVRQCTKSLKTAVDQYVGLNFFLSEPDSEPSTNVQVLTSDILESFKTLGIRSLTAENIIDTTFSDLFTFPDLLQRLHLVGTFDTRLLLDILTECWNLQEIQFLEPDKQWCDVLFDKDFEEFMLDISEHGRIRLDNLKRLHIRWKGVSTMSFLLVLLSVIEARNLQEFHCSFVPLDRNIFPLVTGTLAHFMDTAAKSLKEFSFVVENDTFSPAYFFESTIKFHRDLFILSLHPEQLPTFQKLVRKLFSRDDEREQWLQDLMGCLGKKIKLASLRLEIVVVREFGINWFHFTKHQKSLQLLFIEACWSFTLIQEVVNANARELQSLGLAIQFTNALDMEEVVGSCSKLKYLHLKNNGLDSSGLIINAKFDEILPNLEELVFCDVLIRSADMARVNNLEHLKCLMYSLKDDINPAIRGTDPSELFGLTFEDFKILLFKRNLDYLALTKDTIVLYGPTHKMELDELALNNLLKEQML